MDEHLAEIRARVDTTLTDFRYLLDHIQRLQEHIDVIDPELKYVNALIPDPEWLEMIAAHAGYTEPHCREHCPFGEGSGCNHQCVDLYDWARDLAADLRDWREGQEQEQEAEE